MYEKLNLEEYDAILVAYENEKKTLVFEGYNWYIKKI